MRWRPIVPYSPPPHPPPPDPRPIALVLYETQLVPPVRLVFSPRGSSPSPLEFCLVAAVITITAIVGSVLHVKPTAVPPLPFIRDVVFLLLAFIMVFASAIMGSISVSGGGDICIHIYI